MAKISKRRERKKEKEVLKRQFKSYYHSQRKSDKAFKNDDKSSLPLVKSTGIPNYNYKDDNIKDENSASIKEENAILRAKLEASDSQVAGLQDQVKSLTDCQSERDSVA